MSEQKPRDLSSGEIHELALSRGRSAIELAKAFDSLPYNLHGMAVYEDATETLSDGSDVAVVYFSDQLTPDESAVLPNDKYDKLYYPESDETRHVSKKGLRPTKRLIGKTAAAAIVVAGETVSMGYGFGVLGIGAGALLGTVLVGSVYGAPLAWDSRQRCRHATRYIDGIREHFFSEQSRPVSLLKNGKFTFTASQDVQQEPDSPTNYLLQYAQSEWSYPEDGLWAQLRPGLSGSDLRLEIQPLLLVKGVLSSTSHAVDLWRSGFGDRVQDVSAAEKETLLAERALALFTERVRLTGIARPEQENALTEAYLEAQRKLISATASMVKSGDTWHITREQRRAETARIARAEALISGIARGDDNEEVHPLEMQLQMFTSIVCRHLGRLELTHPDTLATAEAVAAYLQGMRKRNLLESPDQIEEFYQGFYDRFSDKLSELPEWETIKTHF